jgi:transcription termination factor Rho
MTERRRPHRRGRSPRTYDQTPVDSIGDANPYRDGAPDAAPDGGDNTAPPPPNLASVATEDAPAPPAPSSQPPAEPRETEPQQRPPGEFREREHRPREHRGHRDQRQGQNRDHRNQRDQRGENGNRQQDQQFGGNGNGRRNRRNRGRGRPQRDNQQQQPPTPVIADSETTGWFDSSRDGGFVRRAANSYLADPGDAYVAPHLVRQYGLRRGDTIVASTGRDHRGRSAVVELLKINEQDPATATRRPDFGSLTATYPERKLFLETGRPAKGGPELTRRAIDLIAPIGYGQRALIVAPARAGKTMLLHAITEGIAINHPNATLLILLVDERPEEVSEAISWGVGEVIASSFDQPADRHVEVTEMVLEHARRLVEMGKDVVIVLDSLTRMARAHNTAERGSGRTLSGGLDSSAMAKPKAFFGSARSVAAKDGGGSLTIISTALVETGSRMDDVIFEEFKGTGNSEIKLDRSLSEKRIFPAFDIATSGTRREEKLYKPEQLDAVYTLRRGLQQMPPQAAMEWLIKRIANTTNNDALLAGL